MCVTLNSVFDREIRVYDVTQELMQGSCAKIDL